MDKENSIQLFKVSGDSASEGFNKISDTLNNLRVVADIDYILKPVGNKKQTDKLL